MACGDKFKWLIKNDLGNTIEDPCGVRCDFRHVQSWQRAAFLLRDDVIFQAWRQYLDALAKVSPLPEGIEPEDNPAIDQGLKASLLEYGDTVTKLALPNVFESGATAYDRVITAISAMETGVCMLERIEKETSDIGYVLPTPPHEEPKPKPKPDTPPPPKGDKPDPPDKPDKKKDDGGVIETVVSVGLLAGATYGGFKLIKYLSNRNTPSLTE